MSCAASRSRIRGVATAGPYSPSERRGRTPFDLGILADGGRGTVEVEGEDYGAVALAGWSPWVQGRRAPQASQKRAVRALIAIADRAV